MNGKEVHLSKAGMKSKGQIEQMRPGRGLAGRAAWYLFLCIVALVPLAIGALPPLFGPVATIRAYDPFSLTKAVTLLVFAGLSLAAFGISVLRDESRMYWHPVLWVVFGIVGWGVVSTAFSSSWSLSLWGASHRNDGLVALLAYAVVAFLAVQYVRSARQLRRVMMVAVVAGVLVSLYAGAQFIGVDPYGWASDVGRVGSSLGNPDMLGTYLLFPLAMAIGLAVGSRRRAVQGGWLVAAAVVAGALLLSETRGAFIGAMAMGIAVSLALWGEGLLSSRRQRLLVATIGLVLLAVGAGVVLIRPRLGLSSGSLLTSLSNGRTVIWAVGVRAWLTHPVVGWGPDAYARAFESAVGPSWYKLVSGYESVDNAHSFLVQRLVTIGLPGLALTVWAIIQGAAGALHTLRDEGRVRVPQLAVWGALIGLATALSFGVSVPEASVWLWLCVGLVIAPDAHPTNGARNAAVAVIGVVGVCVAIWAASWLVADVIVGRALQLPPGPMQVTRLEQAVKLNPLSENYRGLVADAVVNQAIAEQSSGAGRDVYEGTIQRAIAKYEDAAAADPGDPLIRAALANVLIGYARNNPGSDAAVRAVATMSEAQKLAPHDAAVLVTLARAYQAAGRIAAAQSTAQLAREVAPAYAGQALQPLGL